MFGAVCGCARCSHTLRSLREMSLRFPWPSFLHCKTCEPAAYGIVHGMCVPLFHRELRWHILGRLCCAVDIHTETPLLLSTNSWRPCGAMCCCHGDLLPALHVEISNVLLLVLLKRWYRGVAEYVPSI